MRNTLQNSKSSNLFLKSRKKEKEEKEEILLDLINISEKENNETRDTFCENFFISSFPTENGKIVEDSENIMADCMHPMCSNLPAMQPEIIYKYPENNKNGLEINNLAASICFPNGIKLCYEEDEEKIKTVTNYRTSFTNQIGDKFFVVTYHLFLKMQNQDFSDNYNLFPLRYQLSTYQDELSITFKEEQEEDIVKKLDIYTKLIYREHVYIPFCLCLISKYPFFDQMEKSLESILFLIKNYYKTPEKIKNLIIYLVKSIPLPPLKAQISFALPFANKLVEIQRLYFEDRLEFGDDPIIILKKLSINNILCIFKLLIFEQKILVIGKENDIISQIIFNFCSLLYPYDWIHISIPIMGEKMKKFLHGFLPFFNGMNITLYNNSYNILLNAPEKVFIVNIDNDTIFLNINLRKNSKHIKINDYINKNFGNLPKNIEKIFLTELKDIKKEFDKRHNHNINKKDINIRIKNLFLYIFVLILFDYDKYSYIIDNYPVFNSFLLINEKPESDKKFYKELTSTQLFQMFIQNSFSNDKKSYFDEYYQEYRQLKLKHKKNINILQNLHEKFEKQYLFNFEINTNYSINANNLEKLNVFDHDSFEINKSDFNYSNNRRILKENKRIIEHPIKLNNKNEQQNFKIFVIPEKKKENIPNYDSISEKNENESNSEISIGNSSNKKPSSNIIKIISGDGNNSKNIRYSVYIKNIKSELTEDQIDEIQDNIREIMTRIYKSEVTNINEDEKIIMDCINTKYGRDYFINVITSGIKKDGVVKNLQKDSFECFKYIIYNTLINILGMNGSKENIEYGVKLLKICLYIKTVINKKEILLIDDLFPQLENHSMLNESEFWVKWVEDDMNENDIKILKLIENSKLDKIEIEDDNHQLYVKHSFEIINKLSSIMMKMKLSNSFIYSTVADLGQKYINIIDTEKFGQLMKGLINEIHLYKKSLQKK